MNKKYDPDLVFSELLFQSVAPKEKEKTKYLFIQQRLQTCIENAEFLYFSQIFIQQGLQTCNQKCKMFVIIFSIYLIVLAKFWFLFENAYIWKFFLIF